MMLSIHAVVSKYWQSTDSRAQHHIIHDLRINTKTKQNKKTKQKQTNKQTPKK